ncbi:hypothetical protein DSUL_60116 [Desulfovibrionales bacterium]
MVYLGTVVSSGSFVIKISNNLSRIHALHTAIAKLRPRAVISFLPVCNVLTAIACWGLKTQVVLSERTDPAKISPEPYEKFCADGPTVLPTP